MKSQRSAVRPDAISESLLLLSYAELRQDKFKSAEAHVNEAMSVSSKEMGATSVRVCELLLFLALIQLTMSKFDDAEKVIKRVTDILDRTGDKTEVKSAPILKALKIVRATDLIERVRQHQVPLDTSSRDFRKLKTFLLKFRRMRRHRYFSSSSFIPTLSLYSTLAVSSIHNNSKLHGSSLKTVSK